MNQDKVKATDYLLESIKLIVTIATILFGGLLAYAPNAISHDREWAFNLALTLFALSAISGVFNINSIINKIFRSDEDAIRTAEVKTLNILSTASLALGMGFGACFLSDQHPVTKKTDKEVQTTISESEITVNGETKSTIEIQKNES
jgi:hypothetical protein